MLSGEQNYGKLQTGVSFVQKTSVDGPLFRNLRIPKTFLGDNPAAQRFYSADGDQTDVSEQFRSRIWSSSLNNKYPTYTSVADFIGRVELYRGRCSVVWSCHCRKTERPLVLKAYEKKRMNPRHRRNALREISILQFLHSSDTHRFPGVVSYLGTFEDRMYIYIVQEKCARGDLFKELERKGGTMEESRVCMEVAVPLLLTLRHLHQRAIVHRDIKPENIFFTGNNELKLGDFGLAVDLEKERPVSRVGTLDYMAPEVLASPTPEQIARNAAEASSGYGAKVDVWALGVLVYELVAGRPPFEVQDHDQTALLIMHANLEHFPPQISKHCASFILQALAKKPSERPSAEELLQHPWIRQHYLVDCPVELKPYLHPWSHGREVGFQGGPQAEPRQPLRTGRSLDYRPSQLSDDALEASSSGQQGGKALVEDLSDIRIGPIAAKPPRRLGLVSNKVCKQPQPSLLFGARRGARPGRLAKEEWLDRARRFSCPGGVASPVVLDAAKNGKAAPQHILGKRWDADLGGSGTSGSSAAAPPKPPDDSNGGGSGGPQGGQQFLDGKLLAEWRAQQSQAIHCHTEGRRPQKDASSVTVPVLRSVPLQSPLASPSNPVKAADRQKTSRFAQQSAFARADFP